MANELIRGDIDRCQSNLHLWGEANQMTFDPAKESKHIVSLTGPEGDNFKIIGSRFDAKLTMTDCIDELRIACRWKLRTLMRTWRYYSTPNLVLLYKSHLRSYVGYRTPEIYHACDSALRTIDRIQESFLEQIGLPKINALHDFLEWHHFPRERISQSWAWSTGQCSTKGRRN